MAVKGLAKSMLAPVRRLWTDLKPTVKARMKYGLFRWVLPKLGYEPFTIRNLGEKAWPTVALLSASQDFSAGIERIDWAATARGAEYDDGSNLLARYAKASTPVVLEGYAKNCDLGSLDLETLKSEYGDEQVLVKVGDYVREFGGPRKVQIPLGEFVDYLSGKAAFPAEHRVANGASPYLSDETFPPLARRLPKLDFFELPESEQTGSRDVITFWLGSDDSRTPLHCHHFCDTVIFQLIGSRTFTLVPPHQALQIGYVPHTINIGTASLDPFAADREEFPGWDKIQCLSFELNPGDLLLLPGFWFHAVCLTEPSLSASRFMRSRMPASVGGGPLQPWAEGDLHRGW